MGARLVDKGYLIWLCGCSMSGKSSLMYKILEDFPLLKPINFEKHFKINCSNKVNYHSFYEDIHLCLNTRNVIVESVYCHNNNKWINDYSFSSIKKIIILCEPSYKEHYDRFNKYITKYGNLIAKRRIGDISALNDMRRKAKENLIYNILYTGNEYDLIKEEISSYVSNA